MNYYSTPSQSPRDDAAATAEAHRILAQRQADLAFMEHVDAFSRDAQIAARAGVKASEVQPRIDAILERPYIETHTAEHHLELCDCDELLELLQIDYDLCGPETAHSLYERGLLTKSVLHTLRQA